LALADTSAGKVIVDGTGRTLYLFATDKPGTSACTAACLDRWPALAGTTATVGAGLDQSKVGTISRPDGSPQVTYAGHPLYRFASDAAPGDVKGQGVGDVWFVLGADGAAIPKK
jgi:predicted lipoprotein with Yx(FWY)xxD motif